MFYKKCGDEDKAFFFIGTLLREKKMKKHVFFGVKFCFDDTILQEYS
ncbi:hypothetical protein GCWU000325_01073 [Alloprevotella tannerae ATCC 51259]|uniref:Uncharacterized protein n=1 Tax=Alloprevotella tannerae ATCC 51259 TaxID=626522 RepID=C9LFT5_9BACT|nr:hypothetical protein GCWU000325_01073 [Alloprevotella tannerae ATCC 51259]